MDPFAVFRTDRVTLVKQNGETLKDIPAQVGKGTVSMPAPLALPVEEGDILCREVPGGVVEEYVVLESGYSPSFEGIPAHYSSRVKKKSAIDSHPSSVIYNVNVTGANARFNLHSVDLSSNIQDVTTHGLFEKVRGLVSEIEVDGVRRAELVMQVDKMEGAAGTKFFGEHYKAFISLAADHMALLAPVIPALTQLLT